MKLIDNALFEDLCEKAEESPRRRAHHLIHDSHGEPVQRMLIALQPGTYFRPHRHLRPAKWELVLVLKGIAAWIGFEDDGRVTGRTEAGAHRDCKGLEYPPGTWHSLVCLRPDTVILECKPGPFAPIQADDFAPWAPEEGAPEAAGFVRWLLAFLAPWPGNAILFLCSRPSIVVPGLTTPEPQCPPSSISPKPRQNSLRELLIYCHPGNNQHGKRKARFPLSFIFNHLGGRKWRCFLAPRETPNRSAFPEVVDRVSQGEEIIVTRMGHPVARITRYEPAASNRRLGFFEGRIRLAHDFDDWPEDVSRDLGITD